MSLGRKCLAEFLGTFALVWVGAGIDLGASVPGASNDAVRAIAPGLLVGAFIYALGDISGAHFNPVVSAAFVIKRLFPARWLPAYWIAQLGGAIAGAVVFRALLGDVGGLGVTRPMVGAAPAVAIEGLATLFLVTVILGTADRYRVVGTDSALAVGATIALCGLWAGPLTGASMNPARSLGPAVVSGSLVDVWIYIAGPALGALGALVVARVLHGPFTTDPEKVRAAEGT
ncbi:MAG TPA: aquaporin [Polyangiaceae bacterium]